MPIAGAMQCPAVLSNTFLAHRRGSESCAQPRCQWPRRRAKNALRWTKPLRGSCRVAIVGANPSYCIFERSDCDIMEALLVAALPCRKGACHDCSSKTNDGGYAGTESVSSHAGIVSPTGFAVRTPLR